MDQDVEQAYLDALYPELPVFEIEPADTALLVIDVQDFLARPDVGQGKQLLQLAQVDLHRDYFQRVGAAVTNIQRLLTAARRSSIEVIHVAINAYTDDARECAQVHRTLRLRLPKDDPGNRILAEVAPQAGEIVLYKITTSAFNSTPVNLILQNMGRRTLILSGLATEACVESTARDARDLGYRVIIASDACATYSDEVHRSAIRRMARVDGNACTVEEILSRMKRSVTFPSRES